MDMQHSFLCWYCQCSLFSKIQRMVTFSGFMAQFCPATGFIYFPDTMIKKIYFFQPFLLLITQFIISAFISFYSFILCKYIFIHYVEYLYQLLFGFFLYYAAPLYEYYWINMVLYKKNIYIEINIYFWQTSH